MKQHTKPLYYKYQIMKKVLKDLNLNSTLKDDGRGNFRWRI